MSKPIQPKKKNVAKQTEIKDEVSTPSIITDEKKIDDKIQKLNGTSEVHVQEELEDVLDKPVLPPQPDKPLGIIPHMIKDTMLGINDKKSF